MKPFIKTLFFCVVIIFCTSCKKSSEQNNEPDIKAEVVLMVIKLSPELEEHVLAIPMVDSILWDNGKRIFCYSNTLALSPTTYSEDSTLAEFAEKQLDVLGHKPYILLEEGYAIIDWRWTYYHSLSGDMRHTLEQTYNPRHNKYYLIGLEDFENEEYYLLPHKWTDITDLMTTWSINVGSLVNYEKMEVRSVRLNFLDSVGDDKRHYSYKYVDMRDIRTMYRYYNKTDAEAFNNYIEQLDNMQLFYVEKLNAVIKNKELWEKIGIRK